MYALKHSTNQELEDPQLAWSLSLYLAAAAGKMPGAETAAIFFVYFIDKNLYKHDTMLQQIT